MRPGARRKVDAAVLGIGGLVVGGAAAVGAFAGGSEHVASMWAGAQLRDGGAAAISETIEYDFGNALGKHGIYRDVPGLDPGSDITVESPSAPDEPSVFAAPPRSASYPATRLRIGDPNETVAGTRTYEISYALAGLAPNGNLAWDAVGTGWTVPIDAAEVEV